MHAFRAVRLCTHRFHAVYARHVHNASYYAYALACVRECVLSIVLYSVINTCLYVDASVCVYMYACVWYICTP